MVDETAHDRLDEIAKDPEEKDTQAAPAPAQNGGLRIERGRQNVSAPELDNVREVPLWERDDAPDGSTESSLLVYEDGKPVRVSGPTHYTHLATGEIVGTYGIGTHHDSGNGPVPVVAHYNG